MLGAAEPPSHLRVVPAKSWGVAVGLASERIGGNLAGGMAVRREPPHRRMNAGGNYGHTASLPLSCTMVHTVC